MKFYSLVLAGYLGIQSSASALTKVTCDGTTDSGNVKINLELNIGADGKSAVLTSTKNSKTKDFSDIMTFNLTHNPNWDTEEAKVFGNASLTVYLPKKLDSKNIWMDVNSEKPDTGGYGYVLRYYSTDYVPYLGIYTKQFFCQM
jgi:hypothetical protein